MTTVEMPLFPLNTVLFTGGPLTLRIFEPRYLDMVGQCMREGQGFGVVLIEEGEEAGGDNEFVTTGTVARIVDFDQLEDGLLGITCRGQQRFRVLDQWVRSDKLNLGTVELLPEAPRTPIDDDHEPLVDLLASLLDREEVAPYRQLIDEDWASAYWLGCRLAELLPLPLPVKQALLELDDPGQRLDVLRAVLQEHQVL
ncbi:MAG: LON peptidase substrate-binding domain-containing protein [Candidatus Competibacteraceae bacterium]|nr:LON peptidase substrate-binding domain-containing protein [Candidatus Competibacteraceae bacterium]